MGKFTKNVTRYSCLIALIILIMNANAQNKIGRTELLNTIFTERTISSVKIMDIEFQPGQKGAYHKHPCPIVGYIVSGTCLFQVEGDSAKVIRTGEAFYEPAGIPIVHFDNHSLNEPLKFVAFYLLNGENELIEILHPQEEN